MHALRVKGVGKGCGLRVKDVGKGCDVRLGQGCGEGV